MDTINTFQQVGVPFNISLKLKDAFGNPGKCPDLVPELKFRWGTNIKLVLTTRRCSFFFLKKLQKSRFSFNSVWSPSDLKVSHKSVERSGPTLVIRDVTALGKVNYQQSKVSHLQFSIFNHAKIPQLSVHFCVLQLYLLDLQPGGDPAWTAAPHTGPEDQSEAR